MWVNPCLLRNNGLMWVRMKKRDSLAACERLAGLLVVAAATRFKSKRSSGKKVSYIASGVLIEEPLINISINMEFALSPPEKLDQPSSLFFWQQVIILFRQTFN